MNRPLDAIRVLALVAFLATTACMDRDLTGMDPVVETIIEKTVVPPPEGKVDLLVVVDNSGSMGEEQRALALNFPALIDELMAPTNPEHDPVTDLNIAIVSTDMGSAGYELNTCQHGAWGYDRGDDGCFLSTPSATVPGCMATYPQHLHRGADNAEAYPLDQMGADFACIATLGTGGCGFEQQLEAARKSLTDNMGPGGCNAGFLRDDSILAVVVVSDEEDCSVGDPTIQNPHRTDLACMNIRCYLHQDMLKPVATMIDGLRALRPPERFVTAFIVGTPIGDACEGRGNDIGGCLSLEEMQYRLDPASSCDILPSCTNPPAGAPLRAASSWPPADRRPRPCARSARTTGARRWTESST